MFYLFSDDIDWCKENFGFIENLRFVDNTKTAIDDLMLMRACQHNIIANSTFSWWGAWLNRAEEIKVAPINWFSSEKRNSREIYPKLWNTL